MGVGLVREGDALLRSPRADGARSARHPLGARRIKRPDPAESRLYQIRSRRRAAAASGLVGNPDRLRAVSWGHVFVMDKCPRCDGSRWVCEAHEDRPWEGADSPRAYKCGGAGMPCGLCNTGDPPELDVFSGGLGENPPEREQVSSQA